MSAYIAGRHAAMLRDHGEAMTLKRAGTDLTVMGKRWRPKGAGSDELAQGSVAQNDIIIEISNAEIAASALTTPPHRFDQLVFGGHTYTLQADADTRVNAGVTVAHFLLVKGG